MTPATAGPAVPSAGDLLADPAHGGRLDGAHRLGEAALGDRLVRVGIWLEGGRVVRARFLATVCAPVLAYAEAACRALETGSPELTAAALRAGVRGVHPGQRHLAALVATAVERALAPAAHGSSA